MKLSTVAQGISAVMALVLGDYRREAPSRDSKTMIQELNCCNGDRHKHAHTPDYALGLLLIKVIAQGIIAGVLIGIMVGFVLLLNKVISDLSKWRHFTHDTAFAFSVNIWARRSLGIAYTRGWFGLAAVVLLLVAAVNLMPPTANVGAKH